MGGNFPFYSGPDRRWVEANFAAKSPAIFSSDEIVARVAVFLGLTPDERAKRDAELAAVVALNRQTIAADLKVLSISGMSAEDIAARTLVPLAHVTLWQEVFFDVVNRLGAQGWVVHFVIDPERQAGNRLLAEQLRIAFSGGPAAAELLLRERGGGQLTRDERICILQLRMELKLTEAMAIPVASPSQLVRLCEAAAGLRKTETEYQLAKERLGQQERQAQRCHEEYMQRLRNEYAKAVASTHSFEFQTSSSHSEWTADPADYSSIISIYAPNAWEAVLSQPAAEITECHRGGPTKGSEPVVVPFSQSTANKAVARLKSA